MRTNLMQVKSTELNCLAMMRMIKMIVILTRMMVKNMMTINTLMMSCSLEDGILKTKRRRKDQPGQVQFLSTLTFLQIPIALASRPEHNVFVAAKLHCDEKVIKM